MYLQEYIEELGSAILTIVNSKVKLIGFTCPERLNDYYNNHLKCYFSVGLYDFEPLDFSRIKDDALFIVEDLNNNTQHKYQFKLLKKDSIKYKEISENEDKKILTKVYSIRKCAFTNKFNYKDAETSIIFDTKEELNKYFSDRFHNNLNLDE